MNSHDQNIVPSSAAISSLKQVNTPIVYIFLLSQDHYSLPSSDWINCELVFNPRTGCKKSVGNRYLMKWLPSACWQIRRTLPTRKSGSGLWRPPSTSSRPESGSLQKRTGWSGGWAGPDWGSPTVWWATAGCNKIDKWGIMNEYLKCVAFLLN